MYNIYNHTDLIGNCYDTDLEITKEYFRRFSHDGDFISISKGNTNEDVIWMLGTNIEREFPY